MDDVIVAPSRIHGLGMFAARDFAAGERILRRNHVREVTPGAPIREDLGERDYHCDDLSGGRVVLLGWPDRHFNHCCDPSAYVREIDGVRYIYARRNTATGEEITNDYCMNGIGDTVWECACGSEQCRRTIHSDFFHLPLEKQIEYLPLLMDWFIDERREPIEALRKRAALR